MPLAEEAIKKAEQEALHADCREEIRQLQLELVKLHGAIDEMSIGVATKHVEFIVFEPLTYTDIGQAEVQQAQQMILNPTAVHGIMRAIQEHAMRMQDFGRAAIKDHYDYDSNYRRGLFAGMCRMFKILSDEPLIPDFPEGYTVDVESFVEEAFLAYLRRKLA